MNYKLRDDELIRLQKEDIRKLQKLASTDIGNNSGNVGYSQKALNALAKGQTKSFRSGASRDTATHSGSKGYSAKALSSLSGGNYKAFQKESRKKVPALQKNNAKPRDKRYDKDLENFFNYRVGDFSGEVDYDPKTDTDVETWRNVQKDIMKKHNLSESQFNKMWDDYYAEKTQKKPESKDKNYVVKRDRYDNLMQDNRLANDIKTLAEINYNNANQDATVSKEWAEEYGAKAITGGMTKQQYIDTLSRRYGLTPKELNDMALTFHSDANKEEVGEYGEGLKEFAEKHPVLGSAGSFIGTIGSGIEGMYNVLAGGITGDDRYLSNMFQTTKKSPREGAKENIKSDIGKGAYDIGMGVGDMAAGAATGSAPAILAGNTANEALESSLDRNNSVRQASIYGAGAGALDYITESIGLGKADDLAVNGLKQAGLKQFLKNSAKAGKEELTENVIQNIGQQVLDAIVNDENAELNLSYRNKLAKGEDEISAFLNTAKEYSAQLGFDALLGYGMGSFMQGGASILPALSGMLNNKTSGAGKIPTEDVEIQKIAQDYQNAADEMARLQSQLPEVQNTTEPTVDPAFELASRVAAVSGDFDAYNSMDNMYEMDSFVDQLADEIRNGRDLSGLIEIMEDSLDDAGELEVRNTMQDVINELYRYNEGRGQDGQLSPEEVKVLQDVVDGKYDIPETGETAPANIAEQAPKNPTITSGPIEGADQAKARHKELSKQLVDLNKEIAKQQELFDSLENKKSKGAERKAAGQKLAEMKKQAKAIQQEKSELSYQMKGEERPFKRYMQDYDKDAYNAIYGQNGIMGKLDYATHFAGDTPEAIALRDEIKKIINDTVQSGEFPDEADLWNKVEQLDNIARTTKQPFTSKKGKNYDYDTFFAPSNTDEYSGLNMDVVNGYHSALRSHSNKAVTDRITDALNSDTFNPVTITGDNGQQYRIEKGDNGLNLVTLGEDGNPTWVDNLKDSKALLDKFNKVERDGTKLIDDALQETQVPVDNKVAAERAEKNPTLTGELPRSEGTVPPKTTRPVSSDGEYGKSRVINNSAINAEIISRADLDSDPVLQEIEKYEKHSNEKTLGAAKEAVKENGDKLLNEYINNEREINSDQDVDQAFILLRNLTNQMNNGTDVSSQRNLLLSRLRKAGTKYGQSIQAFAKWNETPEGALINGERMLQEPTESWKSRNAKKVKDNERVAEQLEEITKPKAENVSNGSAKPKAGNPANATSQRLNNALRLQGSDGTIGNGPKAPKTHEQHRVEVENSIRKELGSVADKFNNDDFEYLTTLVEDKVPTEIIADEIEHKLNHGEWYPIDNSKPEPKPINGKLKSALDSLVESDENLPKEELTHDEIVAQVRNTLDKESASIGDFSDDDVDYIANLIQNGATKSELADAMNTKMANGTFGISAETQTKVNQLFELADKYDPNSKEASEAKAAAYKLIADEVVQNATPFEKFEAWRYLAMLGNPKTMLRNLVGNSIFNAVTDVSNGLAATLEAGTDATVKGGKKALNKVFNTDFDTSKGITRTKALLNPAKDAGLIKASWDDAYAHKYNEVTGSKYEKSVRDSIRSQKSVFNSKWAQLYEKLTDAGVSDTAAVRTKYSTSLAGYMKANGLDAKAFDADNEYRALKEKSRSQLLTDAEKAKMDSLKETADKLEKARDYAVKQAEYATFHEDNAIAKFLTEQSQKARNSENAAVRGLGYMLEGVVPFKKTPANILRSGAEYSPLGAIKSLYETGKLVYENTGKRKGNLGDTYKVKNKFRSGERTVNKTLASDVIESWSKSLTGAGLMALGYYLKNKGVLNSSTKEEKWQDDLEGIQNYSITINGKTYTIDWAAPAVMPLLMGAEISKVKERDGLLDKNWYENIDEIAGTVNSLLDPLVETSMMQGVKDTLEEIAKANKYDDKNGGSILGSAATNMLTGYATQGLPTILGQVARTVDNTRRTSDTATDSQILAPIEKQARKMMNKIPGLSQFNPAYRDAYGRTQQNSPFNNPIGNLAYQMGLPSYIRDINTTEPDKQAREVFYSEGPDGVPQLDNKVFPTWKSSVNVDGHKLSPQELETYRKDSGEANYAIRDALTKEKWFNDLSGQKKAAILNKANTLVDKIGKESVGYEQDDKNLDAYKQGLPSLFEKWHQEEVNSQITEATGLSASTNAAKEIAAEMMKGNTAKAEQMMKQATKDKKNLDTLNEKYGTEMKMSDYTEYQKKGGAEAHLQSKQAAEQAGMVNAKGNIQTEQYEKAKGKAGAQWRKLDNDLPTLTQGGLSTSAIYTYANALNTKYASTINPSEYVRQYNIMNTDKENGMTQTEVLQYLNKGNHTQEEADRLWTIYGDGWKQVPVLKGGKWSKKKKK